LRVPPERFYPERRIIQTSGDIRRWKNAPEGGSVARIPYVEKEECISCGVCVETVPDVFRFDDDMKAEVFDPAGDTEATIQEAMDLCPVACIHWKG
jgi:ferredoxin